jgi:hypothetical protein
MMSILLENTDILKKYLVSKVNKQGSFHIKSIYTSIIKRCDLDLLVL